MTDAHLDELTVLLVVGESSDRALLEQWLEESDGFCPRVADTDASFDIEWDVCVLDVDGLRAHGDAVATHRESTATYHPTLLYVPERYGPPAAVLEKLGDVGDHVDETVTAPVQQAALARRLRMLARARRLSTKLAASRDRAERLVRHMPDAVFLCQDGDVTYANPAATSLLGVDSEALIDRQFVDLVPAVDREAVAAALHRAASTGRGGPVETALTRAVIRDTDGGVPHSADPTASSSSASSTSSTPSPELATPVPVEITTIDVGEGDVQIIAHDLRDRRTREEQLALYRRAMDEATIGITIADHTEDDDDEPLVYANETFKQLTGLDDDEIIGHNARVLQTDATDPETVTQIRRAIDAGEEVSVVLLNRRADGRTWYNSLSISPIRNDDGEVTHYLGFQRDVSDRVARDQRLTVLDRVLRHNIRNRLNVVLGYADHIDDLIEAQSAGSGDGSAADPVDAQRVRADANRIRTAAIDVIELSDSARKFREDVVDIGDAEPVDATAVVEEVTARLAAANDDAAICLSLPDERVCVSGAAPLMLVIEELITNALEHVSDPTVRVSLAVDDADAVLRVADDGPGITPDSRTPLEYSAETPTEHGQGIGLWLVRWSVDAVGGTVGYEETPGGGATVVARLPLVDDCSDDDSE